MISCLKNFVVQENFTYILLLYTIKVHFRVLFGKDKMDKYSLLNFPNFKFNIK